MHVYSVVCFTLLCIDLVTVSSNRAQLSSEALPSLTFLASSQVHVIYNFQCQKVSVEILVYIWTMNIHMFISFSPPLCVLFCG